VSLSGEFLRIVWPSCGLNLASAAIENYTEIVVC